MSPRLAVFLILISAAVPQIYAEGTGEKPAYQESVEVKIGAQGDVHVKHVVRGSDASQWLRLVDGNAAGILARDGEDNGVEFSAAPDGSQVLLAPSEKDIIVEYGLPGGIVQKDGVWTMDFSYGETTSFLVPDGTDLIFANGNPVYLGEKRGIACHGCSMLLEYVTDEPRIFESVAWGEDEFLVEIRTLSGIERFEFDQPAKSIRFNVVDQDRFVTAVIPVELLGSPYSVFLDSEKTYFHEYINNGTHVWINTRPDTGGQIEIIGTTVIPEFTLMAVPLLAGLVVVVAASRFKTAIRRQSRTSRARIRQSWCGRPGISRRNLPPTAPSRTA